eukprot:snap_masked-scaffold_1-processed-gene-31.9-mRNA-1 protein AED:0.04 eAED:0.06 QI:0/-1/0/1/-1/1/1/0/853
MTSKFDTYVSEYEEPVPPPLGKATKIAPQSSMTPLGETYGRKITFARASSIASFSNLMDLPGKWTPIWVTLLHEKMQSKRWQFFIAGITIYALFGDDLKILLFHQENDGIFDVMTLICFLIFFFELTIMSIINENKYLLGFFFWLDLLATLSMIPDIPWIWEPFYNVLAPATSTQQNSDGVSLESIQGTLVSAKSSRILRVVRLVRLVRVAKLYGISKKSQHVTENESNQEPSVVGVKLAQKTMERVISLVLVMVVFVPLLDSNFYFNAEYGEIAAGLVTLHRAAQDLNVTNEVFEGFVHNTIRKYGLALHLSVCNENGGCMRYNGVNETFEFPFGIHNIWTDDVVRNIARQTTFFDFEHDAFFFENPETGYSPSKVFTIYTSVERVLEDYRLSELAILSKYGCFGPDEVPQQIGYNGKACVTQLYLDKRREQQMSSLLNILRTIFISFVLLFANWKHNSDADSIVIKPIQRMVQSIKQLTENPMATIRKKAYSSRFKVDDETDLLEETIKKVGQLLQIGFGEAGSRIIAKNMKVSQSINPLVNGVKMHAVFGFCDIRNFTDTTECLQERVMVYVNKVGQIVHEATHQFSGAANKNIGDAFLLVWRIEDKKGEDSFVNMCDKALMAFLKILVDLKRENSPGGILHSYKSNKQIKRRFGDNFNISLGMGLHVGWAIEGAIGSKYKIDASYLSPNVNLAARLEAATKQFKSNLLLSDDFYDYLSAKARNRCRLIDKVTVKGSEKPMGIYTFDITDFPHHFAELKFDSKGNRYQIGFDSVEFSNLQKSLKPEFLEHFKRGVSLYMEGNWGEAAESLNTSLNHKQDDGPTIALLQVLAKHNNIAPKNWAGYRELTEK